jgi:signal transduction histidine kinase
MKNIRRFAAVSHVLFCFWGVAGSTFAIDHLSINAGRDPRFLPYALETIFEANDNVTRRTIRSTAQLVHTGVEGTPDTARYFVAANPRMNHDALAQVSSYVFPGPKLVTDAGVNLTITDIYTWLDNSEQTYAAEVVGYRQDSAFLVRVRPDSEEESLYLCRGSDATGDGAWRPLIYFVDTADYDFDGRTELFLFVNTERDNGPRVLFCVDPNDMRIRWSLPVAAPINPAFFFCCGDSAEPGALLVTQCPSNGIRDSIFDDQYSYFVRVDARGHVVFAKEIGKDYFNGAMTGNTRTGDFYVLHQLPFDAETEADSLQRAGRMIVSRVDCFGHILKSFVTKERSNYLWMDDYDGDGRLDLYLTLSDGLIQIYDRDLNLLADARDNSVVGLLAVLRKKIGGKPVLAMGVAGGTELRTPDLKRLARVETFFEYVRPLSYDAHGNLETILFGTYNHFLIARLVRRGIWDYVAIIYLDYQYYILAVLLSLVVGFVLTNYFRRKTRKNLIVISHQKSELERMHRELKEAQQTIVAQEKYRQAKDIAGGFAHEIRNALFPAEGSLNKLKQSIGSGAIDSGTVLRFNDSAAQAITRAISLTRLISQYTKIESEYAPQKVDVAAVVKEVFAVNRETMASKNIAVRVAGQDYITVEANTRQLYIVLNNLVLNSIDALAGREFPSISVTWDASDDLVELRLDDNGCGVPQKDLPRVFDTFFSTKPSTGTGLGLSMARAIIELYGGNITMSSREAIGTTVTVRLKKTDGGGA